MLFVAQDVLVMTKSTGQIPFTPRKTDFAIWMHNFDRRLYKRVYEKNVRYPKRGKSHRDYEQNRKRTMRIKLVNMLGSYCKYCGYDADIRALQVDHIKGGGLKELRDRFNKTNGKMWRYYLHNPEEAKQKLQVLCANCNTIKKYTNLEYHRFKRPDMEAIK